VNASGITNTALKIDSKASALVAIDNAWTGWHNFCVAKSISYSAIIGTDLLKEIGTITYDFKHSLLHVNGTTVPMGQHAVTEFVFSCNNLDPQSSVQLKAVVKKPRKRSSRKRKAKRANHEQATSAVQQTDHNENQCDKNPVSKQVQSANTASKTLLQTDSLTTESLPDFPRHTNISCMSKLTAANANLQHNKDQIWAVDRQAHKPGLAHANIFYPSIVGANPNDCNFDGRSFETASMLTTCHLTEVQQKVVDNNPQNTDDGPDIYKYTQKVNQLKR
jgi:hypothetical protein